MREPERSAVRFNNRAADGKPEAESLRLVARKRLKQRLACGRRNARSVIRDCETHEGLIVRRRREHDVHMIDCQQNTAHLARLGATEMPRQQFLEHLAKVTAQPGPRWQFEPVYWTELLPTTPFGTT